VKGYYSEKLSGKQLRFCYELAPSRVQQYLHAEIQYVSSRLGSSDVVLELGCGYGRIMECIFPELCTLVGIDTSFESLQLAKKALGGHKNCELVMMDAAELGFRTNTFDCVFCIQNGISAFKVDQMQLLTEALRVTRTGGRALFSSYSEKFWNDRLEWFRLQSEYGLIGEIDYDETGCGTIICKDGFRSTAVSRDDFLRFTEHLNAKVTIEEIDESSIFWEMVKL
jgi:ubiquinone/menaquinone biosynthesis C-methylase UbiE